LPGYRNQESAYYIALSAKSSDHAKVELIGNVDHEGRSFAKISVEDLRRLAMLAAEDRRDFFQRFPDWASLYRRPAQRIPFELDYGVGTT
jgi:hypothetical protein